jgi:hypothetical protein
MKKMRMKIIFHPLLGFVFAIPARMWILEFKQIMTIEILMLGRRYHDTNWKHGIPNTLDKAGK